MNWDHVWVNIVGPDPGLINETLASHGLSRSIKVSVPGFLLAAYTAAKTEMVAILPNRVILPFKEKSFITTINMPFDFPPYTVYQYWHERSGPQLCGFAS
jgi:hypothetical protein